MKLLGSNSAFPLTLALKMYTSYLISLCMWNGRISIPSKGKKNPVKLWHSAWLTNEVHTKLSCYCHRKPNKCIKITGLSALEGAGIEFWLRHQRWQGKLRSKPRIPELCRPLSQNLPIEFQRVIVPSTASGLLMEMTTLESVNSILNTGLMVESQLIAFSIPTYEIKLPLQWLAL